MRPLVEFAKVCSTSAGPLLIYVDQNSDELPAICIAAMLESGATVRMHIGGWADDDHGWDKAFEAFGMFGEESAENFVTKVLPDLAGMTQGGAS